MKNVPRQDKILNLDPLECVTEAYTLFYPLDIHIQTYMTRYIRPLEASRIDFKRNAW